MKNYPLVSFIILNWNGKKWLKNCLPSVMKVKYPAKEIILVNNGSTDNSREYVKKYFPKVKIVEIKKNRGYAGANNYGVKFAKGKYLLFLNNDTVVTSNFLNTLVNDLESDKTIGAVQPQIRSLINKKLLDSVISYLTTTGFMYHYGYMKPWSKNKYQKKMYGYSIKGACFLMKKEDYVNLKGLDEDFVCYVEESDLCHRIWLSGKKVMYDPSVYVYHWGGGDMQVMTKDEVTVFRSYRNRFVSFLKNLSALELIKTLPLLFIFCEGYVLMTLLHRKFKLALGAQLGILSVFVSLQSIYKKRKYIQSNIRKVSDKEINQFIHKNPKLSYYYYFFNSPSKYKD